MNNYIPFLTPADAPMPHAGIPITPPADRAEVGLLRPVERALRSIPRGDLQKAQEAKARKREAWAQLTLRQPHLDDRDHLKGLLAGAGVQRVPEVEPATVGRLRQLLRRAGISQRDAENAVGISLGELVARNPDRPLWWLTATTIECCGSEAAADAPRSPIHAGLRGASRGSGTRVATGASSGVSAAEVEGLL